MVVLFFSVDGVSDVCESGLFRFGDLRLLDEDLLLVGVVEEVLLVDLPDFLGDVFSPLTERS